MSGTAAGVPCTALPPAGGGRAPVIVTWHMLDAPWTDAAFAAALPMRGVPAWWVHLAMPMCGARMVDGRLDAAIELARRDALLAFLAPFVRQGGRGIPGRPEGTSRAPADRRPRRTPVPVDGGGAPSGGLVRLCRAGRRAGSGAAAAGERRAGHPDLRVDAAALVARLAHAELVDVLELAHPLAEEPGLEPAPQLRTAKAVDEVLTSWFTRQLAA
ncbi:alpha/beta hydrolase [Amycolatopsis methanolica]|uniref:alpha/beta hydrolase n=1 Tax=Amycolatopsis methanolica TaxID=1814 RepID=UPI003F4E1529